MGRPWGAPGGRGSRFGASRGAPGSTWESLREDLGPIWTPLGSLFGAILLFLSRLCVEASFETLVYVAFVYIFGFYLLPAAMLFDA